MSSCMGTVELKSQVRQVSLANSCKKNKSNEGRTLKRHRQKGTVLPPQPNQIG
jgi:hypothetical protein